MPCADPGSSGPAVGRNSALALQRSINSDRLELRNLCNMLHDSLASPLPSVRQRTQRAGKSATVRRLLQ